MARIPDDELARLKREVDLAALVRASGVDLVPCGAELRGLCPFHQETTASFSVNPDKRLWRCWGCGLAGDPIRFVELIHHLPFRQAIEFLRSGNLASASGPDPRTASPAATSAFTSDLTDQALLNAVVEYYHRTLLSTGECQQYLAERGLVSSEMVAHFKLGYANRTLCYRLPRMTRKEGQEVRGRLAALGILRESGHEHFSGSLIVPVIEDGQVREVYGRKVRNDLREGTPLHLYLAGPHEGVWNVEALSASREVTLTEAPLDMLTFWAYGHRGVTSAFGDQGFTQEMLRAFVSHGVERVLLAYDSDVSGEEAAAKLAPRLADAGMEVRRVIFPREAKDANDYARKLLASGADVSENLGRLLRDAPLMRKAAKVPSIVVPPPAAHAEPPPAVHAEPPPAAPEAPATSRGEGPEAPRATEPSPAPVASGEAASLASLAAAAVPFPAAPAPVSAVDEAAKGEGCGGCDESPRPSEEAPRDPSPAAASIPFAAGPEGTPALTVHGDQADLVLGDRAYRVGNLSKNLSPNAMRVTLRVSRGERVHVDTLELLSSRARALYIKEAAGELGVEPETVKKDLGKLLMALEEAQGKRVAQVLEPKSKGIVIPAAEKEEALALLRDPNLLSRVVEDLSRLGIVGEEKNKLVAYLAATSRKLLEPLALLIQSNSAAGKSTLMDAVISLMPTEEVEKFTAMTAQSLFYLAETDLKHKVLAITEVAGAERAGYAIKCLQSDGRISIATTEKDPETGVMKTNRHEVEGPVAVFLTTTEAEVDEELANRALVLTVNEDREQTRAIHEAQRRAQTLSGMLARQARQAVIRLHRNAQRLLRPLLVENPYAEGLSFPDGRVRLRRDHAKYLALIQAIALLHQYQRPLKHTMEDGRVVPYIEVTPADIEVANRLAKDVFERSLDDLSPPTRRLLGLLDEMVSKRCAERKVDREDYRFTRREVREHTAWSEITVRKHMDRLVELELLLVHRGVRGQSFVYELVYEGQAKEGDRFAVGGNAALVGPSGLSSGTTATSSPFEHHVEPPSSPLRARFVRGSSGPENGSG